MLTGSFDCEALIFLGQGIEEFVPEMPLQWYRDPEYRIEGHWLLGCFKAHHARRDRGNELPCLGDGTED